MSQRIRGQEVTIQVVIDGSIKAGSLAQVMEFQLNPRTDITETPFLGEIEDDLDIMHHGYDFEFTVHEKDGTVRDILLDIVAREQDRTAHPAVNVVVTYAYRAGTASKSIVLENCFLKVDRMDIGGRKEYVSNRFSGKCKTISKL